MMQDLFKQIAGSLTLANLLLGAVGLFMAGYLGWFGTRAASYTYSLFTRNLSSMSFVFEYVFLVLRHLIAPGVLLLFLVYGFLFFFGSSLGLPPDAPRRAVIVLATSFGIGVAVMIVLFIIKISTKRIWDYFELKLFGHLLEEEQVQK